MRILVFGVALLGATAVLAAPAAEPPFRILLALTINLHRGIETACICKIDGVSVPSWLTFPDTSAWRIDWKPDATVVQKQRGRAFLEKFDPAKPANRILPK